MTHNTEIVYWRQGGNMIDELNNLDKNVSIYFADFCCIQYENVRALLKKKQQEGLKIMLHLPFSYVNLDYLDEPLYLELKSFYDAYNCWLKNDGQPVMVGSLQILDMTKANIMLQAMKFYTDFITKYDFVADMYFVDYVIDSPYYIGATPEFVSRWKFGSYKLANYLVSAIKTLFGRDIKFIGNGWHNCKSFDCMCYENFPCSFMGENGYWGYEVSALDSRYGVRKHNEIFIDKPMIIPGYPSTENVCRDIAFFEKYSDGSYFCVYDEDNLIDIVSRILKS
jgi:hypothetical protein